MQVGCIKIFLLLSYSKYNAYSFYNLELGDINSLVVKNASSYSLRKSLNVVVSRPRTEEGRLSFKHRAAIAWNSLPDTIKQLENPHSFKRKVKIDQDLR